MINFFQKLVKIKKPEVNLKMGLQNVVKQLAKGAKLKVLDYPNGCRIESESGENAIVVVQFGGRKEFYMAIETLENEVALYRVLITSSNVKSMSISEIKWLLNNKYKTKNKWLILDIEHKVHPKTVNFLLYGGAFKTNEETKKEINKGSENIEIEHSAAQIFGESDKY